MCFTPLFWGQQNGSAGKMLTARPHPPWSTTGTHEVGDRIVLQVPCTVAHTQAPPPANKQINTCEFLKLFKIPSGYGKPCICNSSIVELRVWAWLKMQLASVIYETEGGVCPSAHRCFLCCFLPDTQASNGQWYQMNDSLVHSSNVKVVLNQQAYVLFYLR